MTKIPLDDNWPEAEHRDLDPKFPQLRNKTLVHRGSLPKVPNAVGFLQGSKVWPVIHNADWGPQLLDDLSPSLLECKLYPLDKTVTPRIVGPYGDHRLIPLVGCIVS